MPETGEDFKDRQWLWSKENRNQNRYAQIHAFDIEAGIGLGVYLDAGWSPGEALDFLLGILTIDLVCDDGDEGACFSRDWRTALVQEVRPPDPLQEERCAFRHALRWA